MPADLPTLRLDLQDVLGRLGLILCPQTREWTLESLAGSSTTDAHSEEKAERWSCRIFLSDTTGGTWALQLRV